MNLRPRFFIINAAVLLAGFCITMTVFIKIADRAVTKWGMQLAETQLLYDKSRAVQSIMRELTLAKQMSKTTSVVRWAKDQNNPEMKAEGLEELENFRKQFKEGTYFVAFAGTGKYYYSNCPSAPGTDTFKYVLKPDKPADRWFYDVIEEGKDFHINVNPDAYLKVTKLWIDVVMRDKGEVLGVLGTGLDLDTFIHNFTKGKTNNDIISIFTDRNGAIQIYFDKKYIDYASITKHSGQHKSVYNLLNNTDDATFIADSMQALPGMSYDKVFSRHVIFNGKRYLAGISYIPELDWFEITLHDVDSLMNITDLYGIALAFIITMLLGIIVYYFALDKFVIRPAKALDGAMAKLKSADYTGINGLRADGEMGRLIDHFRDMSSSVKETRENLEKKVNERTAELNRLVRIDPMTELLNRRGMTEALTTELKRSSRSGHSTGILWIDIDHFKEVNDTYGHATGDEVIFAVASMIRQSVREYDRVGRWGGDEFIVLMPECTIDSLHICGSRIIDTVAEKNIRIAGSEITLNARVSIGGYMSQGESADIMLSKADKALYQAKESGRGKLVIIGS